MVVVNWHCPYNNAHMANQPGRMLRVRCPAARGAQPDGGDFGDCGYPVMVVPVTMTLAGFCVDCLEEELHMAEVYGHRSGEDDADDGATGLRPHLCCRADARPPQR